MDSNSSTAGPSRELISGWLVKQGGQFKSWKRRWFSIRGCQMLYYKEETRPEDGVKPLGVITLAEGLAQLVEIRIVPEDEEPRKPYCFEIKSLSDAQRTYYCHTTSMKDLERWLDVLYRVVYASHGGGIFGVSVADQLHREHKGYGDVPRLISDCVEYLTANALDEVGIFRLPGSAVRIRELKHAYATGQHPDLNESDVHSVASLLKLYFRELPEPLMTRSLRSNFLNATRFYKASADQDISSIQRVIPQMPAHNAVLLRYLCAFLAKVVEHADENKMTLANVATVFAPNVLDSGDFSESCLMEETPLVHALTSAIISHCDQVFEHMPEAKDTRVTTLRPTNVQYEDYDMDDDEEMGAAAADGERRRTFSLSQLSNRRRPTGEFDQIAATKNFSQGKMPADNPAALLQGPIRSMQEELQRLRQQNSALKRKLATSRQAAEEEYSLRLEAELKLKQMIILLRSMGIVLPNTDEAEAETMGGGPRSSMLMELQDRDVDSGSVMDLTAFRNE